MRFLNECLNSKFKELLFKGRICRSGQDNDRNASRIDRLFHTSKYRQAASSGQHEIQENQIRYVVWTADLQTPPPPALGPPAYDTSSFKIWRVY